MTPIETMALCVSLVGIVFSLVVTFRPSRKAAAPQPTDGLDPKVCETCYQSGKVTGRGELIEEVERLEAELARRTAVAMNFAAFEQRGERIAHLEAELSLRGQQLANRDALVERLRQIEAKQDEIIVKMGEAIADRDEEIGGLKKTIAGMNSGHARLLSSYESERSRADHLGDEAMKLGRMNESIEKRLTDKFEYLDEAWQRKYTALEIEAENRVRDGYSKGYALGQADAFERVRQVFPVDAS